MSLGGFVAATSLFYAGRCSTRYAPLSLLIIVWYAMLDLTLRGISSTSRLRSSFGGSGAPA